ncbi:hypothetical protein [Brevundimonas denitrificans]|uniref:hypothetical protein n=1 Tax=Brevundimonas denitrificans TaxID=1443434 RepID=UPI00223B2F5C|nr:hypothetical protein [Brevundimonas denitrificans]
MNKAQWTAAVDQLMRREWCIGIEDAGIDEQQLTDYWRDGQRPPRSWNGSPRSTI